MRFGGLIAAIVFAAIAAVVVLRMSANDAPPPTPAATAPAQVKTTNIYVAAQAIPIGETITDSMVAIQPWPEHMVLNGFIRADGGNNVVGMVARAPFQAQEPFLSGKVANVQDPNFLASALPKGMRVITMQTNEIEGLAGFVFPGDRVDVLLTRDVQKWQTPPDFTGAEPREITDAVTETLLTNVTVVAVDQRSSAEGATDKEGKLVTPRSVSLMVSPTDAQRIRLGARKGVLTLALRALADRESADPLIITGISDISQYQDDSVAPTTGAGGVLVIRGVKGTETKLAPAPAAAPVVPPAMPITPVPGAVAP